MQIAETLLFLDQFIEKHYTNDFFIDAFNL